MQCSGPAATTGKRRSEETNKKFSPYHPGLPTSSRSTASGRRWLPDNRQLFSWSVGRGRARVRSVGGSRTRERPFVESSARTERKDRRTAQSGHHSSPPSPLPEASQLLSFSGTGWTDMISQEKCAEIISNAVNIMDRFLGSSWYSTRYRVPLYPQQLEK